MLLFFFFHDPPTTEIYTLSLHDALPISDAGARGRDAGPAQETDGRALDAHSADDRRSEEHTSELQSPDHLVCRLLLEKKNDAELAALSTWPPARHTGVTCAVIELRHNTR